MISVFEEEYFSKKEIQMASKHMKKKMANPTCTHKSLSKLNKVSVLNLMKIIYKKESYKNKNKQKSLQLR